MAFEAGERDSLDLYKGTKVHVDGLHSFARAVNEEVQSSFRPAANRLFGTYGEGVPFGGANPSGELHAAKLKYHACLTALTGTMTAYINASDILVTAVKEAAARYSDADAMARGNAGDVAKILDQAVLDAKAAAAQPHQTGRVTAV